MSRTRRIRQPAPAAIFPRGQGRHFTRRAVEQPARLRIERHGATYFVLNGNDVCDEFTSLAEARGAYPDAEW